MPEGNNKVLFEVTHIAPDIPETGRLIHLEFVTREKLHPERFHFWRDTHHTFTESEIDVMAKRGSIRSLVEPCEIEPGQGLWLDEHGQVWLASDEAPEKDPRRLVQLESPGSTGRSSSAGHASKDVILRHLREKGWTPHVTGDGRGGPDD